MAFDLMRRVLLTRGAKAPPSTDIFVRLFVPLRKPDVCLVTEAGKCFSLVPRRVGCRLLKLSQLTGFGSGLQLFVIRLAESAKCRSCSSRLPAARWRARQGGGGGSGGGEGQKVGNLLLGLAGPNTQAKKNSKSTISSRIKA